MCERERSEMLLASLIDFPFIFLFYNRNLLSPLMVIEILSRQVRVRGAVCVCPCVWKCVNACVNVRVSVRMLV